MDGYHTDMIARTGAPDMTSFFSSLSFHPSSPFFLARNRPGFCRRRVLLVLHHLSYRKFAIYPSSISLGSSSTSWRRKKEKH